MNKKSVKTKIKKLITPLAFVLVIILSAFYKFVLKGSGDLTISAFKTERSANVTESTGTTMSSETDGVTEPSATS